MTRSKDKKITDDTSTDQRVHIEIFGRRGGKTAASMPDDEHWTVIQVASYLSLPYQSARNAMLEGRFGESAYDPATRKLTVLAVRVRSTKSKHGRKSKRKRAP